jgi:hypothetical protein
MLRPSIAQAKSSIEMAPSPEMQLPLLSLRASIPALGSRCLPSSQREASRTDFLADYKTGGEAHEESI